MKLRTLIATACVLLAACATAAGQSSPRDVPYVYKVGPDGQVLRGALFDVRVCTRWDNDLNWQCDDSWRNVDLGSDGEWVRDNIQWRDGDPVTIQFTEVAAPAGYRIEPRPWLCRYTDLDPDPNVTRYGITGCELDENGAILLRNTPGQSAAPEPINPPESPILHPYKTDAAGNVLAGAIYDVTMCHTPTGAPDAACSDVTADIGDDGAFLQKNIPWNMSTAQPENMSFTFTERVAPAGFALDPTPVTCTWTAATGAWSGCDVDAFNRVFLVDQPGTAEIPAIAAAGQVPLVYKTDQAGRVIAGERFDVEVCRDGADVDPCWEVYANEDLRSDGSWLRDRVSIDPAQPMRITFTEVRAPVGFTVAETPWVCTYTPGDNGTGSWSGCDIDAAGRLLLRNTPAPDPTPDPGPTPDSGPTPTPGPAPAPAPTAAETTPAPPAPAAPAAPAPPATAAVTPGVARLTLVKRALKTTHRAGSLATYTLRVRNTGTAPATRVVMCDVLPVGTTVHRAPGARITRGQACWSVGTVNPGRTVTKRITLRISATRKAGRLVNNATATSPSVKGVRHRAKAAVTVRPRVASVRAPAVTG